MNTIGKYFLVITIAGGVLSNAGFIYAQVSPVLQTKPIQTKAMQMRASMDQKIAKIKDEAKKGAATRIANQLSSINQTWTSHFIVVLDRLDAIVVKIKSRTQKAKAAGQDVSSTNAAIKKAQDSIAAARKAVDLQMKKTYGIDASTIIANPSTETGQTNFVSQVRKVFQSSRNQLRQDLSLLRDGVMKDARTSVFDALKILVRVPNVDKEPAANSSQNQ